MRAEMVGLVFPGQGAQHPGMGRGLFENSPAAKRVFDEADSVLGFGISRLCFEGPGEELKRTDKCQPAILTTSIASWRALQEELGEDFRPGASSGLSLGEYSSLVAAGSLALSDALRLVSKRGTFMQEAGEQEPGAMVSVLGLQEDSAGAIAARSGCTVANRNCPGQVVFSGAVPAIQKAMELLKETGAKKIIPLEVSGAFHSALMASAASRLENEIRDVELLRPRFPHASNVTASFHDSPEAIKKLLVEQMTGTVDWEGCVRAMLSKGIKVFIEPAPGKVLKGLIKRTDSEAVVLNVDDADSLKETAAALRKL